MNNLLAAVSSACQSCLRTSLYPKTECSSVCAGTDLIEGGKIGNPALGENLQGLTGEEFLAKVAPAMSGIGMVVGVVIFFGMLTQGAIKWIASGGDKAKLEEARGTITNAIIGLVILFSIFAIIQLIETFFGINILTIDIGPLKIK